MIFFKLYAINEIIAIVKLNEWIVLVARQDDMVSCGKKYDEDKWHLCEVNLDRKVLESI